MNRNTLLFDAMQKFSVNVVLGLALTLLSLPTIAEQPSYPVADSEVAALSAGRQHIWIYGDQRIQVFSSDGSQLIDHYLPDSPTNHSAADLSFGFDSVWLAIGRSVYQFDEQGKLIKRRVFHNTVHAIHFDNLKSQILVTTASHVIILDRKGQELKRLRTHLPNIA
ncbi:MAG: hypothetical protein JXA04_10725 [Gammaproteobacteria bacterium]|nr:hypothetical protein [Gammaproteobacteria bacterium]